MFGRFLSLTKATERHTVVDVGVTDGAGTAMNFFEEMYPYKHRITAVGLADASQLEKMYPGLTFVLANGKNMPFADNSFDFAFSSAVIEHVGSFAEQTKFVSELHRVARLGVFLTTPNRWFPVELHTVLPFVHWLPPKVFRSILVLLKKQPLHLEENLNLLSKRGLDRICRTLNISKHAVIPLRLLGFTSNLALYIDKAGG
jgi:ubiquinone/menaquinone biosynthesis C-methylase UbiE